MKPLEPDSSVPDLDLPLVNGATWSLVKQRPACFTLIAFYAGGEDAHGLPVLEELSGQVERLGHLGVHVIAVSADDKAQAVRTWHERRLDKLPIGYDLSMQSAAAWGLALQAPGAPERTGRQVRPAMLLVRPDRRLAWSSILSGSSDLPRLADVWPVLGQPSAEAQRKDPAAAG